MREVRTIEFWPKLRVSHIPYTEREDLPDILEDPQWDVLMQFTGLLDKNGKEIWEGDIIQYHSAYKGPRKTGEVKFDLGMFAVLERNELEKERNSGGHYHKLSALNRVEVIGNIYESPELLRQELSDPAEAR